MRESDNFENNSDNQTKNATKRFLGYDLLETILATMVWFWTQQIQIIVDNTVSSKSYSKNLLMAFDYHFNFQNCQFCSLLRLTAYKVEIKKHNQFNIRDTFDLLYPKIGFLAFLQKKYFAKTFKKCHFSAPQTRLLAPEGTIGKKIEPIR